MIKLFDKVQFGKLETRIGSVNLNDVKTIDLAIEMLQTLRREEDLKQELKGDRSANLI